MLITARDFLSASWANSLVAGMCATLLLPFVFVPLGNLLTKRKRSINKHVYNEVPDNYWFITCRSLLIVGLMSGLLFGFAARSPNFRWEYDQITLYNTFVSGFLCFFIRDLINYWVHRFSHSRLFYKHVHYWHHAIAHPGSGPYDGIYGHPVDSIIGIFVIYVPFSIGFECHAIALIVYIAVFGIFALMLNHCGREFEVTLRIPFLGSIKVYDSSEHDDHHVYRHGNYADCIPFLDQLFGTELVVTDKQRCSLPAKKLWTKVRNEVLSHGVTSSTSAKPSRNSGLLEEECAEIERFAKHMHQDAAPDVSPGATSSMSRRISSAIVERSSALVREIAFQLLEEHPECRPDASMQVCPNVMERRRSTALYGPGTSFALSSPVGRRLSTLTTNGKKGK